MTMTDPLVIAGRAFKSRLIVGTGKYKSFPETARALEASGADMVTVAVRRVNLDRNKESLLDFIDPARYFLLPNTAGCYTADEAIRTARLGREVGLSDWVKLEVIGDQATLYPDIQATLEATRVLVKEGFTVLPYTSDDVVFAKRLLDAGAAAVMPLGAPIGSGLGIQNEANIRILREVITTVPLIVDAGVGTASDAAIAMELGADAVLMNTGIANAHDPILMAEAMKHAVLAGRQAYLAGRMPKKLYATASSPVQGLVGQGFVVGGFKFLTKKEGGPWPPCFRSPISHSEHFDALDVDRVTVHVTSYRDVMSLMPGQRVRVLHRKDCLIRVRDNDHLGTLVQTFLGAGLVTRRRSLGAAHRVTHITVHGTAGCLCRGYHRHRHQHHAQGQTNQQ